MTRESPQIRWVKPQQTRSQETLERLCDAAGELLNDKPIDQISIEEIAAKAGSSVGGFYARFPDKGAMFDFLYERYVAELRHTVNENFDPERWRGVPLADRVHAFLAFALPVVRRQRGLFRAMLFRMAIQPDAERREQSRERDAIVDDVRELLLSCVDEMTHPDPVLATRIGFFSMLAAIHEKELFREAVSSRSVEMPDDIFARELANSFLAYVGACPSDKNPPTIASPIEGISPC